MPRRGHAQSERARQLKRYRDWAGRTAVPFPSEDEIRAAAEHHFRDYSASLMQICDIVVNAFGTNPGRPITVKRAIELTRNAFFGLASEAGSRGPRWIATEAAKTAREGFFTELFGTEIALAAKEDEDSWKDKDGLPPLFSRDYQPLPMAAGLLAQQTQERSFRAQFGL